MIQNVILKIEGFNISTLDFNMYSSMAALLLRQIVHVKPGAGAKIHL
jgi:hypothetical protein